MPRPKKKRSHTTTSGKLRIGDDWNAITIIALSQSNPLKAVAEFVENSIDARARHVVITRGRERGEHYLRIQDDGEGIPRDSGGAPDFRYVATHIGDSIKRHRKAEGARGIQGEFGIGLLSFWTVGEALFMTSAGEDGKSCAEDVLDAGLADRMRQWRHSGFSVHNRIHTQAADAEGRQRLARYMIRCPFALEKMRYDGNSGTVIYRSKMHATLKRNYQLMPALKWLRLLLNHVPDKYEHLVRYYGYYSNRSRGARKQAANDNDTPALLIIDEPTVDTRRRANWARLIQKVYEIDPLKCPDCGATMRIIALSDDADVIERILRHLKLWDPSPDTHSPAGPDPPWPQGETLPITCHPVPDIA
ncbi:MAG: transposase [Gammaproteobacteria bacterium]|nr:transposase [Gammaproteobacteria bacterium]